MPFDNATSASLSVLRYIVLLSVIIFCWMSMNKKLTTINDYYAENLALHKEMLLKLDEIAVKTTPDPVLDRRIKELEVEQAIIEKKINENAQKIKAVETEQVK